MPQITKTYHINSIQQLIDLNEDSKNFKLNFHCKSHNAKDEYNILVLNQSQLDSQDANQLPFKHVVHKISGNITADKSVYQNYFLCIHSDKECKVDITIDKEELPEMSKESYNKEDFGEKVGEKKKLKKKKSFLQSPLFLWIVITIIACVLLYFIFFTKSKTQSGESVHGGSVHGGSVHGESVVASSVEGSVASSVSSKKNKRGNKKKYSFNDFYM